MLRLPRLSTGGLIALLVSASLAAAAVAEEPAEAHATAERALSEPAPSDDPAEISGSPLFGSTVFIDPATGELTSNPTPEQEAQMGDLLRRRQSKALGPLGSEPTPFALVGGGEGMFVGDLLVSSVVILKDAEGRWIESCGDDDLTHDHAAHATATKSADDATSQLAPVM